MLVIPKESELVFAFKAYDKFEVVLENLNGITPNKGTIQTLTFSDPDATTFSRTIGESVTFIFDKVPDKVKLFIKKIKEYQKLNIKSKDRVKFKTTKTEVTVYRNGWFSFSISYPCPIHLDID